MEGAKRAAPEEPVGSQTSATSSVSASEGQTVKGRAARKEVM